jgi:hypothetical protein
MPRLSDLKIRLFTDGADKAQILDMAKQSWIAGFSLDAVKAFRDDAVAAGLTLAVPTARAAE